VFGPALVCGAGRNQSEPDVAFDLYVGLKFLVEFRLPFATPENAPDTDDGLSGEEAAVQARRSFGSRALVAELTRDSWG
jgi:hypothetical protein